MLEAHRNRIATNNPFHRSRRCCVTLIKQGTDPALKGTDPAFALKGTDPAFALKGTDPALKSVRMQAFSSAGLGEIEHDFTPVRGISENLIPIQPTFSLAQRRPIPSSPLRLFKISITSAPMTPATSLQAPHRLILTRCLLRRTLEDRYSFD